ncbi:MAG: transposase, partial [Planctomycetota bacterium]
EQAQNGASLYEAIKEGVRQSPYVNADETGWRVNGQNHWLWVFTNNSNRSTLFEYTLSGVIVSEMRTVTVGFPAMVCESPRHGLRVWHQGW